MGKVIRIFVLCAAFLAWGLSFCCAQKAIVPEEKQKQKVVELTQAERANLARYGGELKLLVEANVIPLSFINDKGEWDGILQEIAAEIGRRLQVKIVPTIKDRSEIVLGDVRWNYDLFIGQNSKFLLDLCPQYMLSKEVLRSQDTLFQRRGVDRHRLNNYRQAVLRHGYHDNGKDTEHKVLFDTREEMILAVEEGRADYGRANNYTVNYYVGSHRLTNVEVYPIGRFQRGYVVGVVNQDKLLLNAVNKAVTSLSDEDVYQIVLKELADAPQPFRWKRLIEEKLRYVVGALIIISLILSGQLFYIHRLYRKLQLSNIKIQEQAETDGLTKLFNRRASEHYMELALKAREKNAFDVFIIMDVDNFKQVNDKLGHQGGDIVLASVGEGMRRVWRSTDILGRWGGDEFIIYMRNAGSEEIVRQKYNQLVTVVNDIVRKENIDYHVTFSCGAYPVQRKMSLDSVYLAADATLYKAKEAGKQRIMFAET